MIVSPCSDPSNSGGLRDKTVEKQPAPQEIVFFGNLPHPQHLRTDRFGPTIPQAIVWISVPLLAAQESDTFVSIRRLAQRPLPAEDSGDSLRPVPAISRQPPLQQPQRRAAGGNSRAKFQTVALGRRPFSPAEFRKSRDERAMSNDFIAFPSPTGISARICRRFSNPLKHEGSAVRIALINYRFVDDDDARSVSRIARSNQQLNQENDLKSFG